MPSGAMLRHDDLQHIIDRVTLAVATEMEHRVTKLLLRHLWGTVVAGILVSFAFGGWLMSQETRISQFDRYGSTGMQEKVAKLDSKIDSLEDKLNAQLANQLLIMDNLGITPREIR